MINFQKINYQLFTAAVVTAAAYGFTRNFLPSVGIAAGSAFLAHLALKDFVPSRSFTAEKIASKPEDIYERKYEEGELKEEETPDLRLTEADSQARPYRTTLSKETLEFIDQLGQEIRVKYGLPHRKPLQSEILPNVSEEKNSKVSASEDNYAELENLPEYLREDESPSESLVDEIYDAEGSPRLLEPVYYVR